MDHDTGSELPEDEELERRSLYDPSAKDAAERLLLLRTAMALGASLDDLETRPNIGELILDLTLRPRLDRTVGDVVRASGLNWPQSERLLKALGLSAHPDDRVTADEQAAIEMLTSAASNLLGFESTVQLARAAGAAMASVAEALVSATRLRVELPSRASGTPYIDIVRQYSELAQRVLPAFVRMLDATLRHQIVAVTELLWDTDPERSAIVLPRTIGFADIVGYTAASSTLSARELTAVLMDFDEATSAIVVDGGGRIVKMIGDEAMFVTATPVDACAIADRLVGAFGQGTLPPVRVGLAAGDVVSVFGDVYGAEVNLAARLVDAAEPSTVLVSERVKAACSERFTFESLAPLELRGVPGPVAVARLVGEKVP